MSPEEMMREEARRMVPRRVKEKCKHGFYSCQACEYDEQVKQALAEAQQVVHTPYKAPEAGRVARDGRAVVTDDAQEIRLTLYDVPLSPRRAIDLAIELLAAAQRHLERAERGKPKE